MRHHRVSRISGQRARDERILGIAAGFVFGVLVVVAVMHLRSDSEEPSPTLAMGVREVPAEPAVPDPAASKAQIVHIIPTRATAPAPEPPKPTGASIASGTPAPQATASIATAALPTVAAAPVFAPPASPVPGARVFVHHSSFREADRQRAIRLAEQLRSQGLHVADVRAVDTAVRAGSVRFFFPDDRERSDGVLRALRRFYAEEGGLGEPPRQSQDLTAYTPKPNNGTIEVWLPSR